MICTLATAGTPAHADPELRESTSTHPGIVHERWAEPSIPAEVHVVRIDLTSAEIGVVATTESQRGVTTSQFAAQVTAQVAINGGSFAIGGYRPYGLAIGGGMAWSNTADDAFHSVFHFRRTADDTGERTTATVITPETITAAADLQPTPDGVISGRPLLIRAGTLESSFDCNDPVTIACQRAPRSALALAADGNTLYLVVVDGWRMNSIGMTAAELARFLRSTSNPDMAFGLDSGASSTLVLDGAVVNTPSDGVEREVANHLAIKFKGLAKGNLTGLICKHDVIACRTDTSLLLPGAKVTLDDGRFMTVGTNAMYNFSDISPRLACVTVRLDGYLTRTACEKVPPGGPGFESVPMFEGMDPPDAGPRDAAVVDPGDQLDSGVSADAGPTMRQPTGCCDGSSGGATSVVSALVVLGLLRLPPKLRYNRPR